jgi:hypothetical protein
MTGDRTLVVSRSLAHWMRDRGGRLGIALAGGLDGGAGNADSATLACAQRRTWVLL